MRIATSLLIAVLLVPAVWLFSDGRATASSAGPEFVAFESGQVRPLAMSPDGRTLFAVNTPNGTLEIFDIATGNPEWKGRVPVGLEPVAVAAPSNDEVWVVNHVSDSVSVVSLRDVPHVSRTLLVGDEPRDIVFAGEPSRAFITTAHRGQRRTDPALANVPGAGDPQLTTPGIPRADVWVFDSASALDVPVRILSFFTDTPRALALSPDKRTVYVAGFKSGNQTTTVSDGRVCPGFDANRPCRMRDGSMSPGGNPGPATNAKGDPAPETGLIVKFNNESGHWEDELKRVWDSAVRFTLPDTDVFAFDADTLMQKAEYAHAGTTLFNMAANPVSGAIYVSNTEAFNHKRFEGPGKFAGQTVQGHLAESRVTVIAGGQVTPRHLNKHLDYNKLAGSPGFDLSARDHSLSTPLDLAVSADGQRLYVAAFGSSKVGVFPTASIEDGSFDPRTASEAYIPVSGGGPSGIVLDEPRGLLYVLTRFDNSVKVVELESRREVSSLPMLNPEPESIVAGRALLYDATRYSGNGEASCASCHQFGDMDDLAWDLGNPDGAVARSPIPINFGGFLTNPLLLQLLGFPYKLNGSGKPDDFHPMKGPFTTQTLRGLRYSGAMHWRGDRSVGPAGTSAFDANISFLNFIGAFQDLVGSPDPPTSAEMQAFASFQLQVLPPPNPVRNLDNSLTPAQKRAADFYSGTRPAAGINSPLADALGGKASFTCNECHELNPAKGFYGTGGNQSFENLPQIVKIPHLRNMYAKVGMFGTPQVSFFDAPDSGAMGKQIRGFGFTGDGSADTLFRFMTASVFRPTSNSGFPQNNPDGMRRDMEQFMLAFDTDLAPIVGQQVTLTGNNGAFANPRVELLLQRAAAPFYSRALNASAPVMECEVVAHTVREGRLRPFLYDPAAKRFIAADGGEPVTETEFRAWAASGQAVTFTAITPGSGARYLAAQ
ncbi:MAG: hypothetical protein JNM66_24275 [Bryobacterales bacterium]|nr:hypothetical protein [Bryobacterales bacterium]